MYTEVFTSRLKKAREYTGISQREAAKSLKIHQSTYAQYETGRTEPNLEMVVMISKLYEVDLNWLLGVTSDSHIGSLATVKELREREKILAKIEKEAELEKRVWGVG
jgi:transcriptional regulator with XRE-family HTH domain